MSDFIFLSPWWLTALVPLALLLGWLARRARHQSLIAPHLAAALGLSGDNKQRRALTLIAICWLVAVLALAGPSFEKQARPSYSASNARVVVMDMSLSMHATDIKPNRLAQARYKVLDLLKGWQEGSTALIAYSGDAYTVSPLTSDSATIANLIPSLSPEIMPYPGANAASGVEQAITMLNNAGLRRGDIIVLADDLDNQESQAIETLLQGTHYRLMILGLGTRDGAPITLPDGSLLKTDAGQTVVAKTDFSTMQSLATQLDGIFTPYRADGSDVERLLAATQNERPLTGKKNSQTVSDHVNNGYWLVLLLLCPALLLFRRGFIFVLLLSTGLTMPPQRAEASPWLNADQQAMQSYQQKDFAAAAEQFSDPEWQGIARYQAKDYQGAINALSQLAQPSPQAQYNLANAYAQAGQLDKAKQLYQQVLQAEPDNSDAKHNLQVVEQALKQQQQQPKSGSDTDKSQPNQYNSADKSPSGNSGSHSGSDKQPNAGQNPDTAEQPNQTSASQPSSNNPASAQEQNKPNQPTSSPDNPGAQTDQKEQAHSGSATSQQQSDKQSSAKQSSAKQSAEQPSTARPQAQQAQASQAKADDSDNRAASATQATTQPIDPELRKLEQVESARDPSQLLRAQLYFQAQDREPPQTQGKKW
ncbi:VWA domain-containing protein [Vibrio sp. ABG19]|uniref:VWA domain-containing protein n=1 Tax=Vibrio sp. ABG19 TaxID=2817385 RepID=UPI00249F8ECC|nr:VWA domain-containing protein [Vibrio sp. ABG19]WGY45838.1 VWA domain-containing protein [Vibrio sp. ABG19]